MEQTEAFVLVPIGRSEANAFAVDNVGHLANATGPPTRPGNARLAAYSELALARIGLFYRGKCMEMGD